MSDSTAAPAIIADPDATQEAANAVDEANHHTPDPQTPPLVEHVPDGVTPDPDDGLAQLTTIVAGLAEAVGTLQTTVLGLVDKDERPHGVPWTHAGMRRDDD